jgi:hypothetical protein
MWQHILDLHEVDRPYPADQVDNPVLFQTRYARVRLDNTTGRPLMAFAHGHPSAEKPEDLLARQESQIQRGSFSEKEKKHLRKLIHNRPDAPSTVFPSVVEVKIYGADGRAIEVMELYQSLHFGGTVPTPEEIHRNNYPTVTLQPGESTEFRMSILGKLSHPRQGLKPGSYTVQATVSYAEAPSGETKHIVSEPVVVTVTEEHIKAAEAYWAAAKN